MSCRPTLDTQYCPAQQTSNNSLLEYSAMACYSGFNPRTSCSCLFLDCTSRTEHVWSFLVGYLKLELLVVTNWLHFKTSCVVFLQLEPECWSAALICFLDRNLAKFSSK